MSDTNNYLIAPAGLPGNDDQAAMATFLAFHLLGMYPGNFFLQVLISRLSGS